MADRGLLCKLLLYAFLFPCVQGCWTFCSWYYSWYLWFGVAWVVIIGVGLCLGIYRRHRIRRMQINQTNRAAMCRSARQQQEHDYWKGAPGYHSATGPPAYENIPRLPSAAPPPYPGSPDLQSEQLPSNNYYSSSFPSPAYQPPTGTTPPYPSGGQIAYPPAPTSTRF